MKKRRLSKRCVAPSIVRIEVRSIENGGTMCCKYHISSIARESNYTKACIRDPSKMHDVESSRSPTAEDDTFRLTRVIYPIHSGPMINL